MRAPQLALAWLGWALLTLAALAGVTLSAAVLFASSPFGRPVVASALVRLADDALAGRLELASVEVLPRGGIELRGLRVFDPDGHLVLEVGRARVFADVTRLRNRVVGLTAELDQPSVLIEEEPGGGISLARAFAPAPRGGPRHEGREPARRGEEGPSWTIRVQRLTLRGAEVWWVDREGATRLEARDLALEARAVWAPRRARAELKLDGVLDLPIPGPLSLELRAALDGDQLRVPVLRARLGDTSLAGLGEADLAGRTGQAALTRVDVDRAEARTLLPAAGSGADLALHVYAEADGKVATLALHVEPARAQGAAGGGDAAVAVRLDGARALGFDLAADQLDPAALHGAAPRGSVTLTARGAAAGDSLSTLRGGVDLALGPSRLRGGELGPAALGLEVDRGSWEARRLSLAAPGISLQGVGRWRRGGAVSGRLTAEARSLAVAARNVERVLGADLPAFDGRAKLEATLSGTSAAPALEARVVAPLLEAGGVSAAGLRAELVGRGPVRAPDLRLEARADRLASGGDVVARALSLRAMVAGEEGRVSASASAPALGREPVILEASGGLAEGRKVLRLRELAIGYPGTRYALARPAAVTLAGPRVDRLELAAGPQRIVLEGGLGPRGVLDAHATLEAIDLARLPVGLLPPDERITGRLWAEGRATGTMRRPLLEGDVRLADAGFRSERGLGAKGNLRWDGGARRAAGGLSVSRAGGGDLQAALDLPLPLAGRPGERLSGSVRAQGLPVRSVLALLESDLAADGRLGATVELRGTVGDPALQLEVGLEDGSYQDLEGLAAKVAAEAEGEVRLRAEAALSGQPALRLFAKLPLDLAGLLARPSAAVQGLRAARLAVDASVPGVDLASLSGRLGLPAGLKGRLSATARLEGRLEAPRGALAVDLTGGAWRTLSELAGHVEVGADDSRVAVRGRAAMHGVELLTVEGALRAPPERLATQEGLRAAPLALAAVIPQVDLARAAAGGEVALAGVVDGKVTAEGTVGRPVVALDLTGRKMALEARPVGDLRARVRASGGRSTAEVTMALAAGGALRATLGVDAPVSIDVDGDALRRAPAEAALRAEAVDLGFLAAALPTTIRTAGGRLEADVSARGPLARLEPRGWLRVAGGRLAISELGDWTDIALDAAFTDQAIELRTLEARRGKGRVSARAALRGLDTPSATLQGQLDARRLTITRTGETVATLDLGVKASGTYQASKLKVRLDVPQGTVKLPPRQPRDLQSLDKRPDIVVGQRPERKRPREAPARPAPAAGAGAAPFALEVRAVAPGPLQVNQDNPRVRLDLKADVTYERQGGEEYMTGTVEVIRGDVEPIGGRRFEVARGRVTFTGGPPKAALLDVEAIYKNPQATVTVGVTGPLSSPDIRLSSKPPMDDAQIAMLIATGRTELKPGGGGVASGTGSSKGLATVGGLVATNLFKSVIQDKLPLDTVALDSSEVQAGKYVADGKVYVGYTRRFDAQTDQGENLNEVRVEYQISPRWTFESRYGDAQSGGASLIWSKDY